MFGLIERMLFGMETQRSASEVVRAGNARRSVFWMDMVAIVLRPKDYYRRPIVLEHVVLAAYAAAAWGTQERRTGISSKVAAAAVE